MLLRSGANVILPSLFNQIAVFDIAGKIAFKRRALEKRQDQDRKKLQESLTDFRLTKEREKIRATEK